MTTREKILYWQKIKGYDTFQAAKVIGISEQLYFQITEGSYPTAPGIAKRIQGIVGFTDAEAEQLMPENRRPLTMPNKYDPDKWMITPPAHY